MASNTNRRLTLAKTTTESRRRTSGDSTYKKHSPFHPSHPASMYLDHTHLSTSLNTDRRVRASLKQGLIDTHFQVKVMSQSLVADSSKTKKVTKTVREEEKDLNLKKRNYGGQDVMKLIYMRAKEKEKKKVDALEVEKNVKKRAQHPEEDNEVRRLSISLEKKISFCGSQVELPDFLSKNGARIVSVDMPPFMQIHAVDFARKICDSLEKFTSKTLASTLKKEFDGAYGPAWHCIVGTNFGSFVTHSVGGFLYFSLDHKLYILLFKTSVQRAD